MQGRNPSLDLRQSRPIEVGAIEVATQLAHCLVDLDPGRRQQLEHRLQAFVERHQRLEARRDPVDLRQRGRVGFREHVDGRLCGFEQRRGVRQALVIRFDNLPFARLRRNLAEFLHNPSQAVLLRRGARRHRFGFLARPLAVAPMSECGSDPGGLFAEAAMLVEQMLLRARLQQRLMRVLTVHIDQQFAQLAQLRKSCRAAIDERAAAPVCIDGPPQQGHVAALLHLVGGEPVRCNRAKTKLGSDLRARAPLADHVGIAALTEREQQGIDEDRLAGTRFTGQHCEAGREVDVEHVDDDEIANGKRKQHRCRGRPLNRERAVRKA